VPLCAAPTPKITSANVEIARRIRSSIDRLPVSSLCQPSPHASGETHPTSVRDRPWTRGQAARCRARLPPEVLLV